MQLSIKPSRRNVFVWHNDEWTSATVLESGGFGCPILKCKTLKHGKVVYLLWSHVIEATDERSVQRLQENLSLTLRNFSQARDGLHYSLHENIIVHFCYPSTEREKHSILIPITSNLENLFGPIVSSQNLLFGECKRLYLSAPLRDKTLYTMFLSGYVGSNRLYNCFAAIMFFVIAFGVGLQDNKITYAAKKTMALYMILKSMTHCPFIKLQKPSESNPSPLLETSDVYETLFDIRLSLTTVQDDVRSLAASIVSVDSDCLHPKNRASAKLPAVVYHVIVAISNGVYEVPGCLPHVALQVMSLIPPSPLLSLPATFHVERLRTITACFDMLENANRSTAFFKWAYNEGVAFAILVLFDANKKPPIYDLRINAWTTSVGYL